MISLVAAMTRHRVIGKGLKLPWHIKSESEHFRNITRTKTLIMGRMTFEAMKKHLESSHTIVITHSQLEAKGVDCCSTIKEAVSKAHSYGTDVFVVGGQEIFQQSIGIADRMQLSFIKKDYDGDKFFPEFDQDEWNMVSIEDFPEFEYIVYARKQAK